MDDMADDILNPRKRGLGRGLDAIFGEDPEDVSRETATDDVAANEVISDDLKRRVLPIDWLEPCDFQPRRYFDEEALEELASSIRQHGLLQPILVRPLEDQQNKYQIIAGERRWRASQKAQLHEVAVIIQYLNDESVLEIALIENLQREDLSPIEEARAMKMLMDEHGHTQEQLAETLGKSRSYIANTTRLLALPDKVQNYVLEGKLSAGHARTLVGHPDAEALADEIIAKGYSVRETEEMLRGDKGGTKKSSSSKASKAAKDINTMALEEEMSRLIGLPIEIVAKGHKGHVNINFDNYDQLDDVLHRLSTNPGKYGPQSDDA